MAAAHSALRVADYDPDWPRQAAAAIDALHSAPPGVFVEIEHIGSTAVPGLAAKPVIDLMAAVRVLSHAPPHEDALADLGFHSPVNGMTDRLLHVRALDGVRSHVLHVVSWESRPHRNQRLLRDRLRAHPRDAARYAALKRAIVASGTARGAYAAAKTPLVQELTDRARAERGLPPEPVWEKGCPASAQSSKPSAARFSRSSLIARRLASRCVRRIWASW